MGAAPALSQAPQPKVLPVSADAPFTHAHSGLTMPAQLIGLPRFEVRELEAPQLDIWARYRRDRDELTVYVYRVTSGAVPVWFDRAVWAVENRGGAFGTATSMAPSRAIASPGSATQSGLLKSWSVTGGAYTGTSLLIAPLGEWLVKLRYSTATGDGIVAETKLREALSALGWPATMPAAPAAAPVAPCSDALAFKGEAKSVRLDGATALVAAMLGDMPASEQKAEQAPATWCRDASTTADGLGVYRADGNDRSYLLAFSDAGRAAWVGPNAAAMLMGKARPNWSIDLILPGRTVNYPAQDRLPSPKRVMAVLDGAALSSISTWGKEQQINVSPDTLK